MLKDKDIKKALNCVEKAAYTKEQLEVYDRWKIDILTARSMLDDAKEEKARDVTLKALKKGMSVEDISDITGLSKQEIELIINQN